MGEIAVTPVLLRARSTSFLAEAMAIRGLGGRLDAALADAQDAAAGMATAAAIQACRSGWSADLVALSLALAGTGGDLAEAAAGYDHAEDAAATRFADASTHLEPRLGAPAP